MNRSIISLILLLLPLITISQAIEKDTVRLYYLGGQSNMDGFGFNNELPDSLPAILKNVWIFHGNPAPDEDPNGGLGIWTELKPGHGYGFSSDGKENYLSERFGVEISFALKIQEHYPNEKIALIKYSRGGTAIDKEAAGIYGSWEPDYEGKSGSNQYDHFLKALKSALNDSDIDNDDTLDYLIPSGIIWMQGESDAVYTEEIAKSYYENLQSLMGFMRAAFRYGDLPVVIGKISDSGAGEYGKAMKYSEWVQEAQEKYAKANGNVVIVRNTQYYTYQDAFHYDSKAYLDLGIRFAEAIFSLSKR